MKEKYIGELEFCLALWDKKGYCQFGKRTNCLDCAAPYILLKLINGEVIHGEEVRRLSLYEWQQKLEEVKK